MDKHSGFLRSFAISLIQIYRWLLSPLLGPRCRFYPTCSSYALDAYKTHSFFRASALTFFRLIKCHPWHPGGIDYVPQRRN